MEEEFMSSMKKRVIAIFTVLILCVSFTGCTVTIDVDRDSDIKIETTDGLKQTEDISSEDTSEIVFPYHYADRDEAVEKYLSNEEYFDGMSKCDVQYKLQDKHGTVEELKEYGASQMQEFSDDEKEAIDNLFDEMTKDAEENGYEFPRLSEITLIRSTQKEECGSGAYTHGTDIYFGDYLSNLITSEDESEAVRGKEIMWHEIFHCLTRNNPDFRKDMYKIIHFTVEDEDYEIPPSVEKKFISNPDVEHHNSHAEFEIDGEKVECFAALIATEPFRKEGDSFFDCMATALVPTDGSDEYYLPEDTDNFWEVFGENTGYVIDPEECMADNFSYAMTYGMDKDYANPEIIEAIIEYVSK